MGAGEVRLTETTFNNPDMTYLDNAFAQLMFWIQRTPSPATDRYVVVYGFSKFSKRTKYALGIGISTFRNHSTK
jgi:hypothetical protein